MKNLKKLVLVISVLTILTSCSKSSSDDMSITPSVGGTVTATIGSVSFQSNAANISKEGNTVTVQGAQTDGKSIQIQVTGLTSVPTAGTYQLYGDSTNFVGYASYVAGPNQTYSSIGCDSNLPQAGFNPTGTVTFTEISTAKIAGTFQFNCTALQNCSDVKIVTAGVFSKTF